MINLLVEGCCNVHHKNVCVIRRENISSACQEIDRIRRLRTFSEHAAKRPPRERVICGDPFVNVCKHKRMPHVRRWVLPCDIQCPLRDRGKERR